MNYIHLVFCVQYFYKVHCTINLKENYQENCQLKSQGKNLERIDENILKALDNGS